MFGSIQAHVFTRGVRSNSIFSRRFESTDLSFIDSPTYVQSLILAVLHWGTLLSTSQAVRLVFENYCPLCLYSLQNTTSRVQFLPPPCPVLVYHFTSVSSFAFLGQIPHPLNNAKIHARGGGGLQPEVCRDLITPPQAQTSPEQSAKAVRGGRDRAAGGRGRRHTFCPVSYTHLDVYKRQVYGSSSSRGGNTSTTVVRSLVLDRSSPA